MKESQKRAPVGKVTLPFQRQTRLVGTTPSFVYNDCEIAFALEERCETNEDYDGLVWRPYRIAILTRDLEDISPDEWVEYVGDCDLLGLLFALHGRTGDGPEGLT